MSPIIQEYRITPDRAIETIASYLPEAVEQSLLKSANIRSNVEMIVLLARNDPDRIGIKIRQETIVNFHQNSKLNRPNMPMRVKTGLEIDTIERYVNNAIVKISNEVVPELLSRFYSAQKLTTIDTMLRFRSGVLSSFTFKTEVGGY